MSAAEPRAKPDLAPELFAQVRAIQIRAERLVTDVMAGQYESAFKGRGMEFEKVREYQPGDDVRHIDWHVTARMRAPYVKEHREERELTVMLVVDLSSSGAFGSASRLKHEVAAEVAAVLAYIAIKSQDRVGLIIFSDRIEHFVPPRRGRAHVWRVIRDILTYQPEGRGTDLPLALETLGRVVPRHAVTFVISDFMAEGYEDALRLAARRHDLTAVAVTDPRELSLPPIGILELEDAETGEVVVIDTFDPGLTRDFAAAAELQRHSRADIMRAAGVGELTLSTDAPIVEPMLRYFRLRERRRRGGGGR